jgi:CRISPR-associated endonuclease/helicase Cas3
MAFALKHAVKHGHRRLIYVIPFTSIIEQNAKVFRDVLGKDAVLEHHCNFTPDEKDWRSKLASENWDAPVIVTTNVQFFNSFFANKTSKCRKLHNIANSIVIFDEVQAIPVEKLQPCLEIIRELTRNYKVSAVLCSATQPAIQQSTDFEKGLSGVREIIRDIPRFFSLLNRTEQVFLGKQTKEEIVRRINNFDQVLCVVSTRKQAKDIFTLLGESDDNFHLSALMYPAHRACVLKKIRSRLKNGNSCKVISTQLIEAGVDVDFPCVFRGLSGMDSIAQAAGRCNREGKLEKGYVYIYEPAEGLPAGYFRQTAQCAESLLGRFKNSLLGPECIREYFLNYYWLNQDRMDKNGILRLCRSGRTGDIQFEELAEFRMIANATEPIVVALKKEAEDLVRRLEFMEFPGGILRDLQRYVVQVYPYQARELSPYLEKIRDINVLRMKSLYDLKTGLAKEVPDYIDISETIL